MHKAVISYKLILDKKRKRILGVDESTRTVEYLPAGEEGRKALDWFIEHLHKGLVYYLLAAPKNPGKEDVYEEFRSEGHGGRESVQV